MFLLTHNYYNYLVQKTKDHEYVDITNEWLIDNYYVLVLKCDKMIINGEESNNKKDTYNYYGFYVNDSLKLIDISSGENNNFVLNDRNGDDGTL